MLLVYENRNTGVSAEWKKPVHVPPHLHEAIEVVYVTDGEIELGVGQELFHMDEGDFAVVFPNVIHHYQVFGKKENTVSFLLQGVADIQPEESGCEKRAGASGCGKCHKISDRNNRGESNADTGLCTDDSCSCFRRNANG